MIRLHEGDCLAVIPQLAAEGVVVDAVCCDPPYHLSATVKRFGGPKGAGHGNKFSDPGTMSRVDESGGAGATARLARGFMGCQWDGGDVAFRPETWATVATVLRPGGFLLAFGGTRTFHRLVCAIEDAGFVIQDTIMWLYGSGFPKRRDALKPAVEPICVAYKPGGKRTLQVDECRVAADWSNDPTKRGWQGRRLSHDGGSIRFVDHNKELSQPNDAGRWPANLCHDGSDEVMEAFAAFGESRSPPVGSMGGGSNKHSIYGDFAGVRHENGHGDSGSAARFFYCAKADGEDRWGSHHPTVKPVELLKWLVPLVTPKGGTFLDPFAGSGTAAVAALATGRNAILIEREPSYAADIRERIAHYEGEGRHSLAAKARGQAETVGSLL